LTCHTWLDDEEDDQLCELPALHEGEHFDSDTGRRWPLSNAPTLTRSSPRSAATPSQWVRWCTM
jgi:hypothetical protein